MAAWFIMLPPLRKQTYQTKWCNNFITGAQEYLSSNTSLGSCERSKVRLRWAWWDPDRMSDERDHVDLLNLTKAMKWRSPGERCLLMHTVWTADLVSVCSGAHGLDCSEHTTQQMTPRWERCCGDRKHGWPESCLRGWSQCGKQQEDELLVCVVILYRVIQKVPYQAKMTFISVFFTSNMSLSCQ